MPSSSKIKEPGFRLSANRTMALADPDTVLVVDEGRVIVFAVEVVDGELVGKRHFLTIVEEGEAAFGVPVSSRAKMGLLATGVGDATVRTLPVSLLRDEISSDSAGSTDIVGDTAAVAELAVLVEREEIEAVRYAERWAILLSEQISTGKRPTGIVALRDGGTRTIDAEKPLCPVAGVCWAACRSGAILVASQEETMASPGDPPLPVAETSWVSALDSAEIDVTDSRHALSTDAGWEGLRRFTESVIDVMARRALSEREEREEGTRRAVLRDARLAEQSVIDLSEALPSRRSDFPRHIADPLGAAIEAVEAALGVHRVRDEEEAMMAASGVEPAPVVDDDQSESVAVAALVSRVRRIAGKSGCRARRASLVPNWWETDNGPLLGFLAADWSPVALIRRRGRYEMWNPATGSTRRVTAVEDEMLRPEAVAFSRGIGAQVRGAASVLLRAVRGSGIDYTKVIVFGSLAGLASLVVPLATGLVFNTIVPNSQRHRLIVLVLVLVAVAGGVAIGSMARGVAFVRARSRTTATAQMAVWDRLLRLPTTFFSDYAVGELLSRAQSVQLSQQIMSDAVVANFLNGVFGIFNLILLLKGGGTLFLVGIVLLIVQFATLVWVNMLASTTAVGRQLDAQNRAQALTLQMVRGINKLRVAAAESRAFAVWARRFADQQRAMYHQGRLSALSATFTAVWPTLTSLAIIGGVILTGRASLQLGNYVAYTTAFTQASTALVTIGVAMTVISNSVSYLEQLGPILDADPEVGTGQEDPGVLDGKIAISHVSFRYRDDGPLVLDDVTIRIAPGEFVAFVGPSGAGKSSVMRLLLGFEHPESGVVAFDDKDLATLDIGSVRRQIGSVIQGAQLLPGTIFTNIAGGLPLTRDEAWAAAKAAGMDNDIAEMPMGMETVIVEGASTLSGGQRQRLLIARALALNPKILFFDEATSALDNITQAQVTESINHLQVTRVVIAHRLSTIKDADRIVVLVAGRVVQEGTYDQLMAEPGTFRDLARRQIT